MKIFISIATFNSAATVADTLESVFNQTHADWDILIKDGGSKGNTRICHEYEARSDGRMKIVACPDKGIYDAECRSLYERLDGKQNRFFQ